MLFSRRAVIELRSTYNEQSDEVANVKNESISNIDLVKYFSAEQYEIARYTEGTLKAQLVSYTLSMAISLTYFAQDLVMETGYFEVSTFCIYGIEFITRYSCGSTAGRAECLSRPTGCRSICDIHSLHVSDYVKWCVIALVKGSFLSPSLT